LLVVVAGIGIYSPLTGKHVDADFYNRDREYNQSYNRELVNEAAHEPGAQQDQHAKDNSLISFTESIANLSQRSGPPSAHRPMDELRVLPLSHHSLWNRLRDGSVFAELEHPKIDLQIEFLQNGLRSLHANLNAARPYLHYIVEQVERAGMPIDIAMLPLVESAFNPHARSSQNALGLWQFIPATGELYGLNENDWYSGRKDVIASTEAALKYLQRLHQMFDGDWLLALAAYNTGQGNLRSAIRRARKKGLEPVFWNLQLAKETRDYVPRLVAVSKMIMEPETYGIILPPLPDRKSTRIVTLDSAISLHEAAKISGIDVQKLIELNPGFTQQVIPPEGPNRLLFPIEGSTSLIDWNQAQRLATSAATGVPLADQATNRSTDVPVFKSVDYQKYTVRKGDNLWNIAQQFDTDLESLANWNLIGGNSVPLQPGDELWYARLDSTSTHRSDTQLMRYRVVATDTVTALATKFNTRLSELKKWNQSLLHSHSLHPGQILYVPVH